MWKCIYCGHELILGADFDAEDYMYDRPGIVQTFSCPKCGAEYTVFYPFEMPEEE